jgi:hypothetical protein
MIQKQNDKFGDSQFETMYKAYREMGPIEFLNWCVEAVEKNCISSRSKKDQFIRELRKMSNKDKMVRMMTNIMLAGEGLGVAA